MNNTTGGGGSNLLKRRAANQSYASNNYYGQNEEKIYSKPPRDELLNPAWLETSYLADCEVDFLEPKETEFFQKLIERVLHPLVEDKTYQAKVARDLKALRNNGCFAFFMINALWMVIIFHLQLVQYKVRDYIYVPIPRLNYEPLRFEPLGFSFLIFFASIVLVQFFSMLWHRYGTVLHLLASTDLKLCARKFNINQMEVEDVVQTVKVLQQIKGFEEEDLPVPDYDGRSSGHNNSNNNQDAYNYNEYNRAVGGQQGGNNFGSSMVSNYIYSVQNPYPRQHKLLKSQIINNAESASIYDPDGGASVYVPVGANSNMTYNSNYFQSKYRQNRRSSCNKSLDVVFRRRWHALSQGKGNQIKQKPRVKVDDIFLSQVSSNIQHAQNQRNSKNSFSNGNDQYDV